VHTATPPAVPVTPTAIAKARVMVVATTTVFAEASTTMRAIGVGRAGRRWLLIVVRRHVESNSSWCYFVRFILVEEVPPAGGRWQVAGGRWKVEVGRWKVVDRGGRVSEDGAQSCVGFIMVGSGTAISL
jgi:hypothetical protein